MIKTILTVLIVLLILRFVVRLFMVTTSPSGGGQHHRQEPQQNPGIKVDKADKQNKHRNDDDAEYIDYEEVN